MPPAGHPHRVHPPPARRGRRLRGRRAGLLVPAAHGGDQRGAGRRPGAGGALPRADRRLPGRRGAGHRHLPDRRPGAGRHPPRLRHRPRARHLAGEAPRPARRDDQRVRPGVRLGPARPHVAHHRPRRGGAGHPGAGDRRPARGRPSGPDGGECGRGPGGRRPPGAGRGEGAAHAHPRTDSDRSRPGHLRPPRARGRAGAAHRRERAAEQD